MLAQLYLMWNKHGQLTQEALGKSVPSTRRFVPAAKHQALLLYQGTREMKSLPLAVADINWRCNNDVSKASEKRRVS